MVPLSLWGSASDADVSGSAPVAPPPSLVSAPAPAAEREAADARATLSGIWWRYEAGTQGQPVRFYYFHGDGTGLYRYGQVGLTNTHSFDYDVQQGVLVLDFRKTGEHHRVPFSLEVREHGEARDWLELHQDPREPGAARYFRESDAIVRAPVSAAEPGPAPAGHMWIDLRRYATGGQGFAMYQLRPAGIDGRGTGWFHRGDFDDWSTESLTYRVAGDTLELSMSLAGTHETTGFAVHTQDDGARWLELHVDPRDYWQTHRYLDMGPSFGAVLAPWSVDPRRPGLQ